MYSAAAGMAAQQTRIDSVANDLANVSTTGYKHERVAFRDLVQQAGGPGSAPGVRSGSGATAMMLGRSQAEGSLQTTGQPLDVAISGPGFIQVKLADGRKAITRDGTLRLDSQGRLGLHSGELLEPPVRVPAGTQDSEVSIGPDGTVTAAGKPVGKVTLVTVPAPDALGAGPGNTFVAAKDSGAFTAAPRTTTLQSGVLESSNTDMGDSMAMMIEAQRAYQLSSKAVQTQDQLLQIANEIKK